VESLIFEHQAEYYQAIQESTLQTNAINLSNILIIIL